MIISSPLKRARQTADEIAHLLNMNILEDERLKEVDGGLIEGTTEQERIEKWGRKWRELDLGIEKPEAVTQRASSFIEDLRQNYSEQKVIVVSHGGLIQRLLKNLDPENVREEHLINTSLSEIHLQDDKWVCERFNCTLHLE